MSNPKGNRPSRGPAPKTASVITPVIDDEASQSQSGDTLTDQPIEDNAPAQDELAGDTSEQDTPADPVVDPTPDPIPEVPPVVAAPVVEEPVGVLVHLKSRHPNMGEPHPMIVDIIRRLDEYVNAMGPNVPMSSDIGYGHQRNLYGTFLKALNCPNGLHRQAIDVVLWYFNEYRTGALSDRLVCRYSDGGRMSTRESQSFSTLVSLFRTTCNPTTRRANLASVNMRMVSDRLPNMVCQQNLLEYYAR